MIQNGEILDGIYQIIREIGRGGTGVIYLAEHLRLHKKVVVKKIKDNFVGQVNGRAEVDILKCLHHTCLPQVYDFLVINNSVYTVMEYIEGNDLQYYLDKGYQFPEQLLYNWLLQLSEVLEYLHSQTPSILHSDIKPSNLMVTKDYRICLIDFNISLDGENAKDVQGVSDWYAAPEQYERAQEIIHGLPPTKVLDGRMDIYSLGATFYRVMTGCLPNVNGLTQDIVYMDIPYSDGMKAIISKMMRRSPSDRFQSARQMRSKLRDIEKMDPIYKRISRIQVISCFVGIIMMITGFLFIYYGNWQNSVERWNKAYQELYISVGKENETEIVSKATAILNDFSFKGYLKKNVNKHAQIFYVLGESYFRQEMYYEAAKYYKEAWELAPNIENYCRDYVIAMVRDGQSEEAGLLLESPQGATGLSEIEQLLILAEKARMDQDFEKVHSYVEQLSDSPEAQLEMEILQKAYQLSAMVYEENIDYENALKMLEKVQKIAVSKDVLRKIGQLSVKMATSEKKSVSKNSYLRKALECYESLNQENNPSYNDKLNLALVERALGNYEDSNVTLSELLIEYPKEYQIPMWMCYNYLDIGNKRKSYKTVMDDLEYRYKDCKYKYDRAGKNNADMEELIKLMDELED